MAINYTLTIVNPNLAEFISSHRAHNPWPTDWTWPTNWPPIIEQTQSSWSGDFKAGITMTHSDIEETNTRTSTYQKSFDNRGELDNWLSQIKITDPTINTAIADWYSAHGITKNEVCFDTDTNSNIDGISIFN